MADGDICTVDSGQPGGSGTIAGQTKFAFKPPAAIAAGAVGTAELADLAVTDARVAAANKDGTAGTPSMRTIGTGAVQACGGTDSRLSNTRSPTAGSVVTASFAAGAVDTAALAALAVTDAKVASANKDGAAGVASLRTLGTGAAQAFPGDGLTASAIAAALGFTAIRKIGSGSTSCTGLVRTSLGSFVRNANERVILLMYPATATLGLDWAPNGGNNPNTTLSSDFALASGAFTAGVYNVGAAAKTVDWLLIGIVP